MAEYDGNIRLGVSIDADVKSLPSQLNFISREIKKVFTGLGKDVSTIPSSFSNAIKTTRSSFQLLQSDVKNTTTQFSEQTTSLRKFLGTVNFDTIKNLSFEESINTAGMLNDAVEDVYNQLNNLGSVDASNPTVIDLTDSLSAYQHRLTFQRYL